MELFNLPNSLTLLRILLIPVFTYFFLHQQYRAALIVFAISGFTDLIDGALARLLHQKTATGAILDPSADKLLMLVTFIVLAISGLVPVWLSALVIFRDVWIISGVLVLKRLRTKLYFKPTRLSKLNTFCQLTTIFLAFLLTFLRSENPGLYLSFQNILSSSLKVFVIVTAVMTVVTGIQYTRIGIMIFRGKREYADLPYKKWKKPSSPGLP